MTEWRTVPFREAIKDCTAGTARVSRSEYSPHGSLAVIDQGQYLVGGYVDSTRNAYKGQLPVIVFGDHTRIFKYVDIPFVSGSEGVRILRALPGFETRFLYHYFRYQAIPSLGYSRHFKLLKELEIPQPPIAEQRRIAQFLDRADRLLAKRRQAIALLNDLTQSIFLNLFGDPTLNDHEWPVVAVADAGAVQLGRQRAPKYQTGKFAKPYLRVANVFEDRIDVSDVLSMDFDSADFEKYRLFPGDILLNEGQSTELVGRPAMFRGEVPGCCFQNTLVRFRPRENIVEPEYALAVFLRLFHTGQFARISSKTSSVAHLGASRFARMPFLLPPLGVQRSYAARVRELRAVRASFTSHLADLDELFVSLQARAFRGEL